MVDRDSTPGSPKPKNPITQSFSKPETLAFTTLKLGVFSIVFRRFICIHSVIFRLYCTRETRMS